MVHRATLGFAAFLALSVGAACGGGDDSSASSGGSGSGGTGTGGAAGGGGAAGSGGSAGSAGAPWMNVYVTKLDLPAASPPPINVGSLSVEFHADVPYGTEPRTRFDIFMPKSATPTPLLIHIHGGGFTGGTKEGGYSGDSGEITTLLGQGIAYASLEYRVLDEVDTVGVIKPLTDCRRALQFIRHHAAALNVEKGKVVLEGGSAGAGTSLWIAFHDDMAQAGSSDPVSQQSTRVLGAAANATQSTYDLKKWDSVVFKEFGISFLDAAVQQGLGQRLYSFYGIKALTELDSPAIQGYRAEVDTLASMSADDPPFFVHNPLKPAGIPTTTDLLFHHAFHARTLSDQAKQIGLSHIAYIEALNIADPSGKTDWQFATDLLTQ